ncbi:MAG: cupredoxin domain-containing protein [Paracoccaceae bacterium]
MKFMFTLAIAIFASGSAFAETITIDIKGFKFRDADINISVGDTIVWVNQDGARHTATDKSGSFNTGTLKKGKSSEVTFTSAGIFDYFCTFHRSMTGRIVVN